jgi:cysteinyl-tRNA synthetase
MKSLYSTFVFDLLGLKQPEKADHANMEAFSGAVDLLLQLRMDAKANKEWATADKIRNELSKLGFEIKDTKEGFSWELKN